MHKSFKTEFDELYKSLHQFNPEDEQWFFPQLMKLIEKYGAEVALDFAKNEPSEIYTIELFVKAGFRDVNQSLLIDYIKHNNEDDVYSAALCLAICDYDSGFELLNQFADKTHMLSKNIDPLSDIIPDLEYVNNKKALEIKNHIIENLN